MAKLVHGIGINDLDYTIKLCPFYWKWKAMLERCYGVARKGKLNYEDVNVSSDWIHATKFKSWMEAQVWEDLDLDKDILGDGKVYSEKTCCFIPKYLNKMLTDCKKSRGDFPVGVDYNKLVGKFRARVNGGQRGKAIHLGYFTTKEAAHKAWQLAKADQIEQTISLYSTEKCFRMDVADALTARVWKLRLEEAKGKETYEI